MNRSARESAPPWSAPVQIDDVPDSGLQVELSADAPTRDAVARLAGLTNLPRFDARFDLAKQPSGALRVTGEVSATVGQTCVVTLEPIENEILESVDLLFTPAGAPSEVPPSQEGVHSAEDEEPPEALVDGRVDLGALATEFLILGIDPYPRKPGAIFAPPAVDDEGEHPFAALAALKKGRERGD
ncbi:MAG TPA: DUF177 domain-containing protein [Xanthobacteraceae bacterium]|jgi:hypothetical protein|nr:DUF177 domain-containing protein [Xanthobacteraceae bacterium]